MYKSDIYAYFHGKKLTFPANIYLIAQEQTEKIMKEKVPNNNIVARSAPTTTGNKNKIHPVIKPNQ